MKPFAVILLSLISIHSFSQSTDSLSGKVKTIYSQPYTVRAKAMQKLIQDAEAFYSGKFPQYEFRVKLYVLSPSDWASHKIEYPYGVPNYSNNEINVAADKKEVSKLFHMEVGSSDAVLAPYDGIAVHELGHYFFLDVVKTDTKIKWMDEFLASYFLICFAEKSKMDIAMPDNGFNPEHRTLHDFETLYFGVGPLNYDWYQKQFLKLGHVLYPKLGTQLIAEFAANYSEKGKREDALVLLRRLAPKEVDQWVKEMGGN